MKKEMKNSINEMKKMTARFPKTINEALNFNEESDNDMLFDNEEEIEEPAHVEPIHDEPVHNEINNASEKAKKLIDDIRKMSLRAMAELADTPEDENYIMLKKVWSMTDRKPEQDKNREI